MSKFEDQRFGNRVQQFVASKADLIFKLKGKERLQSGIDYNVDGPQEAYSVYATHVPPVENGMQLSIVARKAQIFEILKLGDIILGKVVGKRPFGVFVRIFSLVHGRNLDFHNVDIQALCPKSELDKDRKSREHLDPIDDFDVDDIVQGVICSLSKEEERIAISFRSAKLPSAYGDIELGVIEDIEEHKLSVQNFDDDVNYNECLRRDPGFSNPTNVQTLIDVLGIDSRPPCSLLRSCQRWTFTNKEPDSLRKQQSKRWSMNTTATGVESFKNGDHEKALKYLNHALKIYEGNSEALVARGALYANQDKLEYAIKDFKQALKIHPKHHNASKYLKETLYEKGMRLKDVGNLREAITVFEDVLYMDPDNTKSLRNLKELKASLSVELAEEEEKAQKAASLLQENRKKFEHVRKLIKSDPDVVKSNRKKKRKKKKGKKLKKKKQRRRDESETTTTASEKGSNYSEADEWVEMDFKKRSPRPETAKSQTGVNVVNRNLDNNVCSAMIQEEGHGKKQENRSGYVKRRTRSSSHSSSCEDSQKRYGKNFSRRESKNFQDTSSDSSARNRRRNSLKHDSLSMSRGRRSKSRDSRGRRNSSGDSSERNRSRSRSNSLERGRSRIIRGIRGTSMDYGERRGANRSTIRKQRSTSRDSKGRRSTCRNDRGRRSTSRDRVKVHSSSRKRRVYK